MKKVKNLKSVDYQKQFVDIKSRWDVYMDAEKTEFLLKTHELLNDVKTRWEKEVKIFSNRVN